MRRVWAVLVVAALALPLGACDDGGGTTSDDTSKMSLKLTDQPAADLQRAWVEITEIELQGTGGSTGLMDEPTDLVELTQLAGTTKDLVSDVAVSSGEYSQLRIIIGAAAVETDQDDVFSRGGAADSLGLTKTGELICPSCTQTGFKVNLPGGSVTLESESKIFVLDFDVSQSFGRQAGFSGRWVMKPLINTSEFGTTGNIAGTVTAADSVSLPDCGGRSTGVSDFVPEVTGPSSASSPDTHSANVADDGSYSIDFLEPGDYQSGFASPVSIGGDELSFTADPSEDPVTVDAGATATLDYEITSTSCSTGS